MIRLGREAMVVSLLCGRTSVKAGGRGNDGGRGGRARRWFCTSAFGTPRLHQTREGSPEAKFKGTPVIAGYPPTANHGCSNGGLVTDSSSEGCMDTGLA